MEGNQKKSGPARGLHRTSVHLLVSLAAVVLLVWIDQASKRLAVSALKGKSAVSLIDGVFSLHYVENRGAAFGILPGQRWLFVLLVLLVLAVIAWCLYRMPATKRYLPLHILGITIASGAVGNMIDRVANGYVVDFFSFVLIHFPVFNVADIYVTVSAFLLLILILTRYREDDFRFLKPNGGSSCKDSC